MAVLRHSIKVASNQSGLSCHVIRIWEKRYGVIKPDRTGTNRRLYTPQDIEKLALLRKATCSGYSIGSLTSLKIEELQELVGEKEASPVAPTGKRKAGGTEAFEVVRFQAHCLEAVRKLDSSALQAVLDQASVALGGQGLLRLVVAPLAQTVGDLWQCGEITAAHEHLATAVIRVFLGTAYRPFALDEFAPRLVVATPAGQLHELGAVMAAASAGNAGWKVTYLGASLPSPEIAGAALQNKARAVALSLVYPEDDAALPGELTRLRKLLPPEVRVLVGGRAAAKYQPVLDEIQASVARDLDELFGLLRELRASRQE
jgi:MerR family transcriptional regulator, light-induced transcriptional regulator